jgi:hypothetical protein
MRKLLFNYSLYSHPEIGNFRVWQINQPTLNKILYRDSKKEETRRREINKNITAKVGRKVEWCLLFFNLLTSRWWQW